MKINLKEDDLRYGTILGYKIALLELLWNSQNNENSKSFFLIKEEILSFLPSDCIINDTSFEFFSNGILNYYLRTNQMIRCAILIGICIFRCSLVGTATDNKVNEEIFSLAASTLISIPTSVVDSKEQLFKFIFENKNKTVLNIIDLLINQTALNLNSVPENIITDYVFISYSSLESEIAHQIYEMLETNNINCWIAPECIVGGADYASSIPSAIENCKIFLIILSENSQESKWVPKELDLAISNDKVILPFHIDNSDLKASFNFRLTNIQRIDAYGKIEKAYNILVNLINKC